MKQFIAFVAGVALGALVTWKLVKKKYEQIAQEEIDSVKEIFSKKEKNENKEDSDDGIPSWKNPDSSETLYSDYAKRYAANSAVFQNTQEKNKEEHNVDRPYVISPDEFGELDDYECISLTHYSDGVLADDDDELVEDVDNVVGEDYAEHFGEYEDDSVFIRNDKFKCDYEILLDRRKYSELHNITYHGGFPK